MRVKALRD